MELEEGHDDAQAESTRDEMNQESVIERPKIEVAEKTSRLLLEAAAELVGSDQETLGDLRGLDQGMVDKEMEEEMALEMAGKEAEEIAVPALEDLESSGMKEEVEELVELDQEGTNAFITPNEREAEEGTDQWETKQGVHMEEKMIGEGAVGLEIGEKEVAELAGTDGRGEEDLMEEDHANIQEENERGYGQQKLLNLDDEEVEKTTAREVVTLARGETKEVPGSDSWEMEGGSGKNSVKSGESQGDRDELLGLFQKEALQIMEEKLDVDLGKTEMLGADKKGLEVVTLEADVASAVVQREIEGLVGIGQEEVEVLAEEQLGESPLDQGEAEMFLPGEAGLKKTIGMEDVASGVVQSEKLPEIDQREADLVTVVRGVALAVGQEKTENLLRASQAQAQQTGREKEIAVVDHMGKKVAAVDHGAQKKVVPVLDHQLEEGVLPAVEVELVGEEATAVPVVDHGEEEVAAVTVADHSREEAVPENLREGKGETAGVEAVVAKEVVESLIMASQGEVGKTGQKKVASVLDEGATEKAPRAEQKESKKVTEEGDSVLIVHHEKTENLDELRQDKIKEDVTAVVEQGWTTEEDVALEMIAKEAENLVGTAEVVIGKEDVSLAADRDKAEAVTAEGDVALALGQGEAGEVAALLEKVGGLEDIPGRGFEEIPELSQKSTEGEMKSRKSQEMVEKLTSPEKREEKELVGFDQGEDKELESAGVMAVEEKVVSAVDLGEDKVWLELCLDQAPDISDEGEKVLKQDQQEAAERKILSQEKVLVWSPELDEKLSGETQEKVGVDSREWRSRLGQKLAEQSQEETVVLARVGWMTPDFSQDQMRSELARRSPRVANERHKLGSSAGSSVLSQWRATPSQRAKGKRISGLAGLRQGPVFVAQHGATQSRERDGVLKHVAPGLIVTSLTAQAEQRGLIKQNHKKLKVGKLEQRGTRSAELGRLGTRVKVGEGVVLMGYRVGRERMSCFSEPETPKTLQVPLFKETERMSGQELAELPKQEQEVRELEKPEINVNNLARQDIEEVPLAWLGRPLTQDYMALRPSSGWTAGLGPGHGLALGPLRARIKERIDMAVVGQGTSKSGLSPEQPNFGIGRRVFGLASKSEDVHWLKEVLESEKAASQLSVTGHGSNSKGGVSGFTAERQSAGLLTGKQELKDWRDGVMGIAIKRYNAVRLALWGEGPVGLQVKGVKMAGGSDSSPACAIKTSSLLGQVEQKVLKLAQHVTNENAPLLGVEGQGLSDTLKQDMEFVGPGQGSRVSRSSLPQENEILEVQSEQQEQFSAHTANSETGSPERRLGCQGTQELDGSSQWLADQNEAGSQHALEQDASITTTDETIGTRSKEQERIKMQSSPPRQHCALHTQVELETAADRMTGSNPVSPASSGSPVSSGSISPPHLAHDSSLDSHLGFDVSKTQNRALVSPGMYISPDPASMWDKTHAEIAEQAKHEAEIENRIAEMKKEGFWSLKRLSKVPEPVRPKVHWDYLCEEMQWLSADFAQERRWKRGVARKVVRMVIRHHEEQKQKEERAKREEQAKLRRIASSIAKEVKQFWTNVEKVVQFKQQSRLEEKRKKALDLQLDFIVGQTEKYSDLLTQSLNETLPVSSKTSGSHAGSTASSPPPPSHLTEDEDGDFQPHEESDDEETIEVEEQQEGNDSETQQREIELLKQESELPLEELLQSLPPQVLENSFSMSPCVSSSDNDDEEEGDSEEEEELEGKQASKNLKEKPKPVTQRNKTTWKPDEEDEEFAANEEEAEDEEETIDAEEKLEGDVDHSKELDDLAKEGELPMEELLQKYAGAYASDFEIEESDISSEALDPSTSEYEEESEEEGSSSHSESTDDGESEQDESEDDVVEEEAEVSVNQEEDFGVEYLLKQDEDRGGEGDNDSTPAPGPKKEITDIAAAAESLQPKGYTLATTQVKTPIPYLLRGTLREYQHIGLDWLVTMYEKKLNGILADEMGLGKTIQTISLLAHLACEKGSWGPHLIIVPTSVMLNWEMEIKRWCPSFKILTYYGAQKERKLKRQGWTKPNAFHICITSYKLVLQDHQAFRRKNWKYLILDEAQNIKNFKSQRWQSLLNFNSQRRLLLTGTPLQNSLMELWSLMHFLMPHVFQSHREFKEWFSNPLTGMIEGSQEYNENLVKRLHKVLRPFLLRRVKVDVEKQMPKKYEHVIKCRLSKRQRYLYDDFMAQATTKETLATGHFMSVINILMQLRKHVDLGIFDLINLEGRVSRYETDTFLPKWKVTRKLIEEIAESPDPPPRPKPVKMKVNRPQTQTLVPTLSQNNTAAALLQGQASAPQVLPMAMTAAQLVPNTPRPLLPPPPLSPVTTTSSSLKPGGGPVSMGQQQPISTLSITPVGGQPPPPINTLGITSVGQQPISTKPVSTLGIPPVGQQQQQPINPLGVSALGGQQQQPPPPANTLGPTPAVQQSTSTMAAGTIGGMMKPVNIHPTVPALPGYNFATGPLQQRLLLSPDMQARLPSGEVVSLGQLASLANRPLQSAPGSKPLTFQIQGNKLTLTGTQVRQVTMPQPARQLPRNVVHLVSAGGQHHIISQPAQVALIQAMAQQAGQAPVGVQAVQGHQPPTILPVPATSTAAAAVASTATISVPIAATQVPSSAVNSSGVVKIVVRQAPRDGLVPPSPGPQQAPLRPATPTTATTLPGLSAALMAQRAPLSINPVSPVRLPTQPLVPVRTPTPAPLQALVRPMLRMVQAPNPGVEQQLVTASSPPTVAPFAVTPATTVTVATSTPPVVSSHVTSSPVPREEPELLTLRSTTPTPPPPSILAPRPRRQPPPPPRSPFYLESLEEKRKKQKEERLDRLFRLNEQHCNLVPIYGTEVLSFCTLFPPAPPSWKEEGEEGSEEHEGTAQETELQSWRGASYAHCFAAQVQRDPQRLEAHWQRSESLAKAILTPQQRIEELRDIIERFIFVMPPVEAPAITMHTSHPPPSLLLQQAVFKETLRQELSPHASCLHRIICNMRTQFPDLRLIQYDCGKLQTLDVLLRQLKAGAHRVLIFTQMTRMLDVLEQFLNYHGHIYLRLDGSTRVEQRQALMERFNADKRIFCFILSTRSGGVGVNLTGADTVVFYDSDWNPTMDAQAQDRCHRIGQTRDVHIYRLISERTVEENILKKANQKRMLGDMAIEGGNFTTAYFKQQTIRELFDMPLDEPAKKEGEVPALAQEEEEEPMATKQAQILEQALCKAEDPEDIRAATQAKAEQVAELAEFNENIPLDAEERPSREEEEELSKAEQEIASLVEQLTPIERYAMNFLEASLEDISREELKQAEEQVEAARKDIDQAKDEVVFKLPEDEDESYVLEEGSSKKSKKARVPSRTASERTGTRMSERLRSTRLPPQDGDSGDVESTQARLPNLRHSRVVTDEEDDGLPQVAQHTRGAAVRRELVRDEKPAQVVLNTRKHLARREEAWTKTPAGGERVQKTTPHRTEPSGDRGLRTNPHRVETSSVGDKLLQGTPQKPDPGSAGDRVLRGMPLKAEAQPATDRLPQSSPQITHIGLEKVLRPGPQKPEKPSGLDRRHLSPPKPEAPKFEVEPPQLHSQGLDGTVLKQGAYKREQKEEGTPLLNLSASELQVAENVPTMGVPAFQASCAPVAETLLDTQKPPVGEVTLGVPAAKEKASSPVPLNATHELPSESKPTAAQEVDKLVSEQKESLLWPQEETDKSIRYSTAEQASLSSVDKAPRQEASQEMTPSSSADGAVATLSSPNSEGIPLEATSGAATQLDRETPKTEVPVLPSPAHSTAATSSLAQLETLPCADEQNGLEQPSRTGGLPGPISNLVNKPQLEILPPETVLQTSEVAVASSETNNLSESPKQMQGVVGKRFPGDETPNEAEIATISTGAVSSHVSPLATVTCPGALSSDESLSPAKPLRRRTSADVQIRQSCQEQDGPTAKVLRKLPGRLVTVVEEKELIRRRRNRVRILDAADSTMTSPSNSSAQSMSEPEISPTGKELPLLRDLPARRRIELECRAAAKERDDSSKRELLISPSIEPVKRKRGRPPKNKSSEQPSPDMLQPLPEPVLEINLQSKAPKWKLPKTQPQSKTPEQKVLETQPSSKATEKMPQGQPLSKGSEQKVPETQPRSKAMERRVPESSSPKSESPKSKTESSENDSPVEKRRRGRPPKVRESPIMSPKASVSGKLSVASTKPLITDLSRKVQKQLQKSPGPTSVPEATSKSLDLCPKTTPVSKATPKPQNQMHPNPSSVSKSTLKARELLATPLKPLSKSSTEACESLAIPPRAVSATETSTEMQKRPSPSPLLHASHKAALGSLTAESPPKRKRGRPPKNPPSPQVEAAPPPASTSDQETSTEKQTPAPPVRKRRRRRRKDELGPSLPTVSQSSSEGEDTRPLTRLARHKLEEKPESGGEGVAQPSPKPAAAEGASSAESSAWEQPFGDTPTRSTRLRPGSLVPPLERETQRRKRRCSLDGSR
ncbi:Helicase domino, partial [Varanus komodoensis]